VKKNGNENEEAECCANLEAARDCNSINERMKQQSRERGNTHGFRHLVHFLTKMEMRNESVLRQMNQQKSDEDQRRSTGTVLLDCFRCEIEYCDRYHEPGRESDQLLECGHAPFRSPCDCGRACNVGNGREKRVRDRQPVHV